MYYNKDNLPREGEVEVKQDPRQTRFVGGLHHAAGWQEVDVAAFTPEGVVQSRI